MSDDVLIRCENVGKKFCRDLKKSLWYGVKDSVSDLFGRRKNSSSADCQLPTPNSSDLRPGEFWANKGITFEVQRGECLGLIGRNGAGKTTLLKLLNGLVKPDMGRIEIHGRVGALIALGAGFTPALTGRENLQVNASILGMSRRQIADVLDDIVEFAEIGQFIDTPVQNYSSGMTVRLGFAIATCLRPDVLIVDEVLAVGDADFRLKCLKRMKAVLGSGCAVLLVSHNMTDIRNLSKNTIWLRNGKLHEFGNPHDIVTKYLGTNYTSAGEIDWQGTASPPGGTAATLRRLAVASTIAMSNITISSGAVVEVEFECYQFGLTLGVTIEVSTEEQITVFHSGKVLTPNGASEIGHYTVQLSLPPHFLNSGKYWLSVIIGESQSIPLASAVNAITFEVENESIGANYNRRPGIVSPQLKIEFNVVPSR